MRVAAESYRMAIRAGATRARIKRNGATSCRRSHRLNRRSHLRLPCVAAAPPDHRRRVRADGGGSWKMTGSSSSTATWWTRWGRTRRIAGRPSELLKGWTAAAPGLDVAEGRAGADPRVRRAGAGHRDRPGFRRRLPAPDPGPPDVALLVEVSEIDADVRTAARNGRPMPRAGSPSTGSSTWSTARSRSTPGRASRLPVAQGLQGRPASPGRDRRPAAPPDRRRRHPALTAACAAPVASPSGPRRPTRTWVTDTTRTIDGVGAIGGYPSDLR